MKRKASTISELLAVIVIIALIAAILLAAKKRHQAAQKQAVEQAIEKPEPIVTKDKWNNPVFEKIAIEGHEYLAVDAMGIVHNENCSCRKK